MARRTYHNRHQSDVTFEANSVETEYTAPPIPPETQATQGGRGVIPEQTCIDEGAY